MHDDRKYQLRLYVIKGGYDAVDCSDGLPLLEHFKTLGELQVFLLTRGIDTHRVMVATCLLAKGKDTSVFGLSPH